jgi:AAA+ ATPase superfamily predicted ATPase
MAKFFGREEELEGLKKLLKKGTSSLVVLLGRRRIGKSRLAEEFAKQFPRSYIFTGLSPSKDTTIEAQCAEFWRQMNEKGIPSYSSNDWGDLFSLVAKHCQTGRVLVVLDEITWMGSKDPNFLGKLKIAWDLYFKKNPKLILIISGSNSAWIEKNILSSTGYMGRVSHRLLLRELPLHICYTATNRLGHRFAVN